MVNFCTAFGYSSTGSRDDRSFHRLPKVLDKKERVMKNLLIDEEHAWLHRLSRADLKSLNLENVRICSDHFIKGN